MKQKGGETKKIKLEREKKTNYQLKLLKHKYLNSNKIEKIEKKLKEIWKNKTQLPNKVKTAISNARTYNNMLQQSKKNTKNNINKIITGDNCLENLVILKKYQLNMLKNIKEKNGFLREALIQNLSEISNKVKNESKKYGEKMFKELINAKTVMNIKNKLREINIYEGVRIDIALSIGTYLGEDDLYRKRIKNCLNNKNDQKVKVCIENVRNTFIKHIIKYVINKFRQNKENSNKQKIYNNISQQTKNFNKLKKKEQNKIANNYVKMNGTVYNSVEDAEKAAKKVANNKKKQFNKNFPPLGKKSGGSSKKKTTKKKITKKKTTKKKTTKKKTTKRKK